MLYDRFHLNHPEIPFIIEFTPFFAILIAVVFFKMNSAPILTPIPTPTTAVNDAVAGNAATKSRQSLSQLQPSRHPTMHRQLYLR